MTVHRDALSAVKTMYVTAVAYINCIRLPQATVIFQVKKLRGFSPQANYTDRAPAAET
jgi:hypothetical protein